MRRPSFVLRLWPGGTLLWQDGAWYGLVLAVGFGVLLDLALLTTLIWTDVVDASVRAAAWFLIAVIWMGWLAASSSRAAADDDIDPEPLFQKAVTEYLKGDWLAAERLLGQLLKSNDHDSEARLMLATLLRRTGRLDEAARQLDTLARQDNALKWAPEIVGQHALIARQRAEGEPTSERNVWRSTEDSADAAESAVDDVVAATDRSAAA